MFTVLFLTQATFSINGKTILSYLLSIQPSKFSTRLLAQYQFVSVNRLPKDIAYRILKSDIRVCFFLLLMCINFLKNLKLLYMVIIKRRGALISGGEGGALIRQNTVLDILTKLTINKGKYHQKCCLQNVSPLTS